MDIDQIKLFLFGEQTTHPLEQANSKVSPFFSLAPFFDGKTYTAVAVSGEQVKLCRSFFVGQTWCGGLPDGGQTLGQMMICLIFFVHFFI